MNFQQAKRLLDSGVPIKHEKYGTIYSTTKKDTYYIYVGEGNLQKIIVNNIENVWIYQPKNYVNEYVNLSSLDVFKLTEDWIPYIRGELK